MIFDIAKKVAYAACELDWLRKAASQAEAAEAASHINTLHECAIELAGRRAREIYTDPYDLHETRQDRSASEPNVESPDFSNVIAFCAQRERD
jgi:hypothetical protein